MKTSTFVMPAGACWSAAGADVDGTDVDGAAADADEVDADKVDADDVDACRSGAAASDPPHAPSRTGRIRRSGPRRRTRGRYPLRVPD
jgi:hypothetical protein